MPDIFQIEKLKNRFKSRNSFSLDELHEFYKEFEPELNRSTLRWRIYELKDKGVLRSVKRGWYSIHEKDLWHPVISEDLREMYDSVHQEFPYLEACIWTTQWLVSFFHHVPIGYLNIIDTEKGTEESVFNFVREQFQVPVMLNPTEKEIHNYIDWNRDHVIVRTLISQSPLVEINGVKIPKLEKIMVDLYSDVKLFELIQGRELTIVNQNLFDKYAINWSTLKRYAIRRNRWNDLRNYLTDKINNTGVDQS